MSPENLAKKNNKRNRKKDNNRRTILACGPSRYPIVRKAAMDLGWELITDEYTDKAKKNCNLLWIDTSNIHSYFLNIQPWQCINHIPGMTDLARKTRLAQHLELMKKQFPKDYSFFPSTFILPRDSNTLKASYFANQKQKSRTTFILKPDGGCQGRGIFLTKSWSDIEHINTTHVAQRYITNPLLIENKKFDLRLYVLVTSCDPLRIYLYRDGLVRFCTENFIKPNSKNLDSKCMHLTNYAINKYSDNFQRGNDTDDKQNKEENVGNIGSKRSVKWFLKWLEENKGQPATEKLWSKIGQICVKTILSVAPTLVREYNSTFGNQELNPNDFTAKCASVKSCNDNKDATDDNINTLSGSQDDNIEADIENNKPGQSSDTSISGSRCFAILGFDIMISSKLNPFLIEVNHLPSFATDSELDGIIKYGVVEQALAVVNAKASDKRTFETFEKMKRKTRLERKNPGDSKEINSNQHQRNVEFPLNTRLKKKLDETTNIEREQEDHIRRNTGSDHHTNLKNAKHQTAKEIITNIYAIYAPEKVGKIDLLLKKYSGFEDWLVSKVKEKYLISSGQKSLECVKTDERAGEAPTEKQDSDHLQELDQDEMDSSEFLSINEKVPLTIQENELNLMRFTETKTTNEEKKPKIYSAQNNSDDGLFLHSESSCTTESISKDDKNTTEKEIQILKSYDCLFPSSYEKYQHFLNFSMEQELKQYRRITCPLPRSFPTEEGKHSIFEGKCAHSNSHATSDDKKYLFEHEHNRTGDTRAQIQQFSQPLPHLKINVPNPSQIKAADRLSKGMSSIATSTSYRSSRRSLDENDINATRQRAIIFGKNMRRKNEEKFVNSRPRMLLKEINLELQSNENKTKGRTHTTVGELCYIDFTGKSLGGCWS